MFGNCRYCGKPMGRTKQGFLICTNTKGHPDSMVYVPGKPKAGRLS